MTTVFEQSARLLSEAKNSLLKNWYHDALNKLWYLDKTIFQRQKPISICVELTIETIISTLKGHSLSIPLELNASALLKKPFSRYSLIESIAPDWRGTELSWNDIHSALELLEVHIQRHLISSEEAEEALAVVEGAIAKLCLAISYIKIANLEQCLADQRDEGLTLQHMAGRFLANSSHELRTPLTAVLGFSELLLEETYGEINGEQRTAIGHIENSAQNLLEIVNNFLDLMHIRAGKLKLAPRPVDITLILHNLYSILSPLAIRRKVTFLLEIPDNLGVIEADEGIVRHMVYYLLSSALRATPEKGKVVLKASRRDPFITIQTHDTALHLPQDALANMEDPYTLLENSPTRGYEGWEIGLPLVKRYVTLHDGKLELESLPETGTIFRILLPTYHQAGNSSKGDLNLQ